MTTFLDTDEISPLDWYLAEPNDTSLFNFYSIVPPDIVKDLIEKYGRFWISKDGIIKYRECNSNDITVDNITIGNLGNKSIVRVNGTVVPTVALEQLRVLLRFCDKCNFDIYSNLLDNISQHKESISRTIH